MKMGTAPATTNMRNGRDGIAYGTLRKRSGESLVSWCRQRTIGLIVLVLLAAAYVLLMPEKAADCKPGTLRDYLRLEIGDIRAEVSWRRCSSAR